MTQLHPHEADSPAARKAGNPIRSAHTILALAASALLASAAHADPISGIGWNQVFSDDFNGTAVDETLWTYRTVSSQRSHVDRTPVP
jgi:hypothetical protein